MYPPTARRENFLEVDDSPIRNGTNLALCTCSLALGKEAVEYDDGAPRFAIMPAMAIR